MSFRLIPRLVIKVNRSVAVPPWFPVHSEGLPFSIQFCILHKYFRTSKSNKGSSYPCNTQWRPTGLWGVEASTWGTEMALRYSLLLEHSAAGRIRSTEQVQCPHRDNTNDPPVEISGKLKVFIPKSCVFALSDSMKVHFWLEELHLLHTPRKEGEWAQPTALTVELTCALVSVDYSAA
jgi:hypothetical protein